MDDHTTLRMMNEASLQQQQAVREQTFSPDDTKQLRRFSTWEVANFIFGVNQDTFRKRLMDQPELPQGMVEKSNGQRWFTIDEITRLRRGLKFKNKSLMPPRPKGRALRIGVSNFKGGVGKTVVAQHLAHAAALDGYRVLVIDFDPQATLTHSMGLTAVSEEQTVWGIMCRDLCKEADRIVDTYDDPDDCPYPASYELPDDVQSIGRQKFSDFILPTCWGRSIHIIPSCANAAFVEFASAQYRNLHPGWTFFGCVSRYLDELPEDDYDLIIFDCPPAIGYQSLNAAFAADVLYIPSGPGYWEYDSTTSFLGQLATAMEDISAGYAGHADGARLSLPKEFLAIRVLMTRYEASNELHEAMKRAFHNVFAGRVCEHAIEMTRAVEQSGRFQNSIYEQDYREMTRDTWKRARKSFDEAYEEFRETILSVWPRDGELKRKAG
ncbi:AAA family ATPase [Mangrovicoccus sp. HB161399]|uniref:AAA family ATPase n=1 Tax=Mangrovicoccus sp. HB161399 TaxID=2720392 RepID=UPI0015568E9E|nr:AAA family ATPase [Mangrovicoccus sp. HB161399]